MTEKEEAAGPLSDERRDELVRTFLTCLGGPVGFRDGTRAGMLLIYLQRDGIPAEDRQRFVHDVLVQLSGLPDNQRRNVAHGLGETRQFLESRPPGMRTLAAVSLWEQLIERLPLQHQYLAREGQLT